MGEQRQQIDSVKIMNTHQPNTIEIDGVEVPSYYNMWLLLREIRGSMTRLRTALIVLGAAIVLVAAKLLLA